jgi:hypothetical protein
VIVDLGSQDDWFRLESNPKSKIYNPESTIDLLQFGGLGGYLAEK